jgi:hypothetical protein
MSHANNLPPEVLNALTHLEARDAATFRKKFNQQAHVPRDRDHTCLELAAGVYIARLGYTPLYERQLGRQTPDWDVRDADGEPVFFADVYTFHMAEGVEKEQERQLEEQGIFCGHLPPSEDRLYSILQGKTTKYKRLADEIGLPFVVFVFGCFEAFLQDLEVRHCLQGEHGLFGLYPQLSGVYHFESIMTPDRGQVYDFHFFANHDAARPIELPNGFVPRPIPARGD